METTEAVQDLIQRSLKRHPGDRKRFWAVILKDGRRLNEHQCRWADVPLHEIQQLKLIMMGNKYVMDRKNLPSTFVEFVHFKTAVKIMGGPQKTISRCIGWHDGTTEYVVRVDEVTGKRSADIETYSPPQHLHPKSKMIVLH